MNGSLVLYAAKGEGCEQVRITFLVWSIDAHLHESRQSAHQVHRRHHMGKSK